jgi:hypothetical protein
MSGLDPSTRDRDASVHQSSHQTDQHCVESRLNLSDV